MNVLNSLNFISFFQHLDLLFQVMFSIYFILIELLIFHSLFLLIILIIIQLHSIISLLSYFKTFFHCYFSLSFQISFHYRISIIQPTPATLTLSYGFPLIFFSSVQSGTQTPLFNPFLFPKPTHKIAYLYYSHTGFFRNSVSKFKISHLQLHIHNPFSSFLLSFNSFPSLMVLLSAYQMVIDYCLIIYHLCSTF